ncbi:MAG: signal peptidase I [Verrucomicrobiales bacterium]
MFAPKYIKHGKLLLKGLKKFLRYHSDEIAPERMEEIGKLRADYEAALEEKDEEKMKEVEKQLTKVCKKAVPDKGNHAIRENVEVLLVAIVIAVGIRAYFLQPFKIPTGSMQPTLNGIVETRADTDELGNFVDPSPGFFKQAADLLLRGRSYIHLEAPGDGEVVKMEEKSLLKFFTFTEVTFRLNDGSTKSDRVWTPIKQLIGTSREPDDGLGTDSTIGAELISDTQCRIDLPEVTKGQVLASGYVDTGDQVLVDKVSYHFRRPKAGEVFVFSTAGIEGIEATMDRNLDSIHYIKRLIATEENKTFRVVPPNLYIDGELAETSGSKKVMKCEDGYNGYTLAQGQVFRRFRFTGDAIEGEIMENEYLDFGDNSDNSFDSRGWGPVPEQNLVGPALVVYYPFAPHFGGID